MALKPIFVSFLRLQKRSAIGKASRSAMKAPHTSGTKSFAQIREEEVYFYGFLSKWSLQFLFLFIVFIFYWTLDIDLHLKIYWHLEKKNTTIDPIESISVNLKTSNLQGMSFKRNFFP